MKVVIIENHASAAYTIRAALINELKIKGFDVYIFTGFSNYYEKLIERNINVRNIGESTINPILAIKYLYRLYINLREIKPHICLTYTPRPNIYGNLICSFLRIPTVTNITGIGPFFHEINIVNLIVRSLYKLALYHPSKVFFQNNDDIEILVNRKYVNKNIVERIPGSGIELEKFLPQKKLNNLDKVVFLFIGRLVKLKGIFEYVEASKNIINEFTNVEFQVLGPLWEQNRGNYLINKETVESWKKEGIVYLGETSDVRKFIINADCIVLPSYREGISNVLLEAASMERAIVTTNVTGCRDVVEDEINGFLCEPANVEDLTAKLKRMFLLSEEERMQMGKAGRIKMIKEYDKKKVLFAYINAINLILNESDK